VHRPEGGETGVVDQDVRGQPKRRNPVEQARTRGPVRQVGSQYVRTGSELGGELLKL
jgi:hypothetical protein